MVAVDSLVSTRPSYSKLWLGVVLALRLIFQYTSKFKHDSPPRETLTRFRVSMCVWMVDQFGNKEQREKWIPQLASMNVITKKINLINRNVVILYLGSAIRFLLSD